MSILYFPKDMLALSGTKRILTNFKWFLFNHTAHLVLTIRLGQSLNKIPYIGRVFGFFIEYFVRIIFSSDISVKCKIGPGLVIAHGHDIVIGADVKIGANCTIFNGVTLGNKDIRFSSLGNQPRLGDNIVLSTGSKVLGAIFLENGCVVGANAVVIDSFPSDSLLVGVPARNKR